MMIYWIIYVIMGVEIGSAKLNLWKEPAVRLLSLDFMLPMAVP
jgi:hypothetical protein